MHFPTFFEKCQHVSDLLGARGWARVAGLAEDAAASERAVLTSPWPWHHHWLHLGNEEREQPPPLVSWFSPRASE